MVWITVSQYRSHCPDKEGAAPVASREWLVTFPLCYEKFKVQGSKFKVAVGRESEAHPALRLHIRMAGGDACPTKLFLEKTNDS